MSMFVGVVNLAAPGVPEWPSRDVLPQLPGVGVLREWRCANVAVLHRQSICTPQDVSERQPLPIGSASVVLFNGRLDDRTGLASELGIADDIERTDSELLALAVQRYDHMAATRVIGDYSFAVWDGQSAKLLLAVDASGQRPLYWYRDGNMLSFASYLPALLALPWVKRTLDEDMLTDFLAQNHGCGESTFFKQIKRLLPGSYLRVSATSFEQTIYWSPSCVTSLRCADDNEYLEAAQEVLDKAVAARLRCHKPLVLLGSGGLDSSLIASNILRQRSNMPLRMVTMVPEPDAEVEVRKGTYPSEREAVMRLAAELPGLRTEFVSPLSENVLIRHPDAAFRLGGYPTRTVLNLDWLCAALERIAGYGGHSYMNGDVGNFTLTWNGVRNLANLLQTGRLSELAAQAWTLSGKRLRPTCGYLWNEALRPLLPSSLLHGDDAWKRRLLLRNSILNDSALRERMHEQGCYPQGRVPGNADAWRAHFLSYNLGYTSDLGAWIKARFGLEARAPLFDRRLVEFCLAIPADQFLSNGQTRSLGRRLCARQGLTKAVYAPTERGEWSPDWFRRLDRERSHMISLLATLRQSPIACRLIDLDRVASWLLEEWPANTQMANGLRQRLDYVLTRTIQVGAFICWVENGAT